MRHRPGGVHVARVDHHEARGPGEQGADGVEENLILGQMVQHVERDRQFGRGQKTQALRRDEAAGGMARGATGQGGGGNIHPHIRRRRVQQRELRGVAATHVNQALDIVLRDEAVDDRRLETRQPARRSRARRPAAAITRLPVSTGGEGGGYGHDRTPADDGGAEHGHGKVDGGLTGGGQSGDFSTSGHWPQAAVTCMTDWICRRSSWVRA